MLDLIQLNLIQNNLLLSLLGYQEIMSLGIKQAMLGGQDFTLYTLSIRDTDQSWVSISL